MTNQENWNTKYEALRAYVTANGHFPNKHTKLCNWVKYQRKRLKSGLMSAEQEKLFLDLSGQRSSEHTGGKKKLPPQDAHFCGELWGDKE